MLWRAACLLMVIRHLWHPLTEHLPSVDPQKCAALHVQQLHIHPPGQHKPAMGQQSPECHDGVT